MQPRGLLFDFDGTLYGDWRLWVAAIQDTLEAFHVNITGYEALEKARNMIKNGTFYNISGVAIELAQEQGVVKDQEVRAGFLAKMDTVMDADGPGIGLVKTLNRLKRAGFQMGLVTFMRQPRLSRRLDKWKLSKYFQSIITPELVREFKPSPVPYVKAIGELGLSPMSCFVVGDEPVDMTGGKSAGARTIGLPQGFFSEEELKAAGADLIIQSLKVLPDVLRNQVQIS